MWELGDHFEPNLKIDQAFLNVTSSSLTAHLWLYFLSEECVRCPFVRWFHLEPMDNTLLNFSTSRALQWKVFANDVGPHAFSNV